MALLISHLHFPFLSVAFQGALAALIEGRHETSSLHNAGGFRTYFDRERTRRYGEGRIEIIRKFSRRRRGVIYVLRCQFGQPVILIVLRHHGPQPYHPSVMMKAPMPILFHGKFRDVDWRVKPLEID
jgi:hypothetical protein